MINLRKEITLPVPPWYADHHFAGHIVLAAVEAMQILATAVQAACPHLTIRTMQDARFDKLLTISPQATHLTVVVEMEQHPQGALQARLLTRTKGKTMSRLVTHCVLLFTPETVCEVADGWTSPPGTAADLMVSAQQVYRELVPFGPAYRTLQDQLRLCADAAYGTLLAPECEHTLAPPLGSSFPLDGAMHAACVHGQRLVAFVPFPVGFTSRSLLKPTKQGEQYSTWARLQWRTRDELSYDICILDQEQQVREMVRGLRMRDVSHGRITPPPWIREPNV